MAVDSKGLAAQRRAVRAHKERIFVVSRTFRTGPDIIRILFNGNYYDVGPADLARLESGKLTPEDLELYPVDLGES